MTWLLLAWRLAFLILVFLPVIVFEDFLRSQFSLPEDRWAVWGFYGYVVTYSVGLHLTRSLQALLLQREATIGLSIEWYSKLALLVAILFYSDWITLAHAMWANAITGGLGALYMLVKLYGDLGSQTNRGVGEAPTVSVAAISTTAWHNYFQRLISTANSPGANRLLCRFMLDSAATAGFGFAMAVTGVIRRFAPATLLLGLIEPSVMARYSQDKNFKVLMRSASIVVKFSLFVLAPVAAWILFAGQPIAAFVSDGKYTEMTWLIAGLMVTLMINSNRAALTLVSNAVNESGALVRATAWANLLWPLVLLLIYTFGLPGLFAGILTIFVFDNIYLVHRLRKRGYDYRIGFVPVCKILLCAVMAGAAGSLIPHFWGPNLLTSILAAVAAGILFLLALYLWKPFTAEERRLLNQYIGKNIFVW